VDEKSIEEIAAMAVAAIAEELQTDLKRVRITRFEDLEMTETEDDQ